MAALSPTALANAIAPSKSRRNHHARKNPSHRRAITFGIAILIGGMMVAGSASAFQPDAVAPAKHQAKEPVVQGSPQTPGLITALAPPVLQNFRLAPAKAKPKAAPAALSALPSLQSHEVFGFAPYWSLAQATQFNLQDLTTVDYFGLDVNGNGTINESGDGWTGYQSQDLANLISSAHAAGDRVVLTAECFSQSTLNQLAADPSAGTTLGKELVALVEAKNLDGINIDFEGQGSQDQQGLDELMANLSKVVRAADPHWQITMDTYASSAGDTAGFYDIAGLAPSVDAFFVMAYQMGGPNDADSAYGGSDFSATDTMQEYTQVVPASKVILGLPYYGYDWPTSGPAANAVATGPATPVPDSQLLTTKQPIYWNVATETAWTSFESNKQWYQEWFLDPTALAAKAEVANSFGARGVGIWTLGMDGNDPAMLAALVGNSPVVKDYAIPPSSSTTTSTTAPKKEASTTTTHPTSTTDASTTTSTTSGSTTTSESTTTTQPTTSTTQPTTTTTGPTTSTTTDPSTTSTTQPSQPTTPTT
jgi:spore germination protein YaaH